MRKRGTGRDPAPIPKGASGINPVRKDCGPVVERRPGSSYQDRREIRRASVELMELTRAPRPNSKMQEHLTQGSTTLMKRLDIRGDAFHPEWNYLVVPRSTKTVAIIVAAVLT